MKKTIHLLIIVCWFVFPAFGTAQSIENVYKAKGPRYQIILDFKEFSVFNQSVAQRIIKNRKGVLAYDVKIGIHQGKVVWVLVFKDKKNVEILRTWLEQDYIQAEKKASDKKNPNKNTVTILNSSRSLSRKFNRAIKMPQWEEVRVSGEIIAGDKGKLHISGTKGRYEITGSFADSLKKHIGEMMVAHGNIKIKDQIEIRRFTRKKTNTLELFVMSQCPYGRYAQKAIIELIERLPKDLRPYLKIRYISKKQGSSYTSMRGESEINENLVQMVLRDFHADKYFAYLLKRADFPKKNWLHLARELGINEESILSIQQRIIAKRDKMLGKEYTYCVENYGIINTSPTWIWESEQVKDITEIELFEEYIQTEGGKCSG